MGSFGEKLSTRSGPECMQKGITAICLGKEQEAIEWISVYEGCRDPKMNKLFGQFKKLIIPYLVDFYGQFHPYQDYPIKTVDSFDFFPS